MKISAIVPAFNEEKRISPVLKTLEKTPLIKEIIVVDDGSTDRTVEVAKQHAVKIIQQPKNLGKGQAMEVGVNAAKHEIIFFCDADVIGLTPKVVEDIIQPVLNKRVDMFIGMRNRKIYRIHQIISIVPLVGGERALKRELWENLPSIYKEGFKIETALNFFARHYGKGFGFKIYSGLSQTIKEKKYGFWSGTVQRWSMIYEIIITKFSLFINYYLEQVHHKIASSEYSDKRD